jgi:hypothetical protein
VRLHEDRARHQAWLTPAREADIMHAHALCREYGVEFALADPCDLSRQAHSRLTVEAGAAWATLASANAPGTLWRADAGCSVSSLQALELDCVRHADPALNVAQWMSSQASARWPTGQGALSGIEQVQIMLADGTIEILGPFGANAVTPLRSLTVQQMVPRLFELATSVAATQCLTATTWPARFRLDALIPAAGLDVNLAWLMTGHGGSLAWVQAVWFRQTKQNGGLAVHDLQSVQTLAVQRHHATDLINQKDHAQLAVAANQLDQQLKLAFDPHGVFPTIPAAKGLESAS